MSLKVLSLLFIILWINSSSSAVVLPDVPDCSKADASRDILPPTIWLATENLEDEDFLMNERKVRRIVNETRIFTLRCLASFPIRIRLASVIKTKKNINQVGNNLETNFLEDVQIYSATTKVLFEPGEKFTLEATCVLNCTWKKFFYGAKIYTKEDERNLNKIYTQHSSVAYSSHVGKGLWRMYMYFAWIFFWGLVFIGLILACTRISQRRRESEDIELADFENLENNNTN